MIYFLKNFRTDETNENISKNSENYFDKKFEIYLIINKIISGGMLRIWAPLALHLAWPWLAGPHMAWPCLLALPGLALPGLAPTGLALAWFGPGWRGPVSDWSGQVLVWLGHCPAWPRLAGPRLAWPYLGLALAWLSLGLACIYLA